MAVHEPYEFEPGAHSLLSEQQEAAAARRRTSKAAGAQVGLY
jgi:hypothetical protein